MAFSVAAVSSSVSPLFTEEVRDRHVDHVGAQPLAGQFEAGARARRVLEEQVDQRPAAQQVALGLARAVEQHIALRQVEQMADLGRMQALDRQQVLLPVRHDALVAETQAGQSMSLREAGNHHSAVAGRRENTDCLPTGTP